VLEEGEIKTEVTVRGLTKSGYLLADDAFGARFELHPDGNSFDFFQGLVRKKLS
jgi:biotin--protein ligase